MCYSYRKGSILVKKRPCCKLLDENNQVEHIINLDQLLAIEATCVNSISEKVALMISDIEMPEMDGYTLTAEIKSNDRLKKMPVILHTSLSGVFNNAMVEKVGAEDFIPKFHPDELATAVKKWLKPGEIS